MAIGAKALEPLLAAYEKASEPHRREIAFALAALGIEDPRIEAILATRDPDEAAMELYRDRGDRTPEAWDIFAEYAERGVPEVEALSVDERIEMLASDDEEYRILAAASLFHEDLDQRDEDILFARARTDSSETVRAHCWQALDNAINREEIATEMIARLQDTSRSDQERSALLIGLSAISDRPEIRPHLEAFYRKPETRLKALEAMWRSLDPDFTEYFPEHLNDPDLDIRRVALRGVGGLGITSELGKVRKLLRDPEVREDALYAYAMASPGKSSPAFLRSLLDRIKKEAGPLSEEEEEVVRIALDERLRAEGKPPIFLRGES